MHRILVILLIVLYASPYTHHLANPLTSDLIFFNFGTLPNFFTLHYITKTVFEFIFILYFFIFFRWNTKLHVCRNHVL